MIFTVTGPYCHTNTTVKTAKSEEDAKAVIVESEPTWTFLPASDSRDWSLEVWKDYTRFIKVFNHATHKQPADPTAEKELREKYGNDAFEVICDSFEQTTKRNIFFPEIRSKKTVPQIDVLPPFDWHDWCLEDWNKYLTFLEESGNLPSAKCTVTMRDFFKKVQFLDRCTFSSEKLTDSPEEVKKIIASLKESDKKKLGDPHYVKIINGGGTAAASSATNPMLNNSEDERKATYSYDPKQWNIADLRELNRRANELWGVTKVAEILSPQYFKRSDFFQDIRCATFIGESYADNQKEKYKLFLRRETIRTENIRYLNHHLFRIVVNGEFDRIPRIFPTLRIFHNTPLTDTEVPFAICTVKGPKKESLVFKLSKDKIETCDRNNATVTYSSSITSTVKQIILTGPSDNSPDFFTIMNGYYSTVCAWRISCHTVLLSSLDHKLLPPLIGVVNDYLYPETIAEAKDGEVQQAALLGPAKSLQVTSHSAASESAATAPARQRQQRCSLSAIFGRLFYT